MNLQLKGKLFLLVFGLAVVTLTTSLIFVKQKDSSNATSSETILPVAKSEPVAPIKQLNDTVAKFISSLPQSIASQLQKAWKKLI